MADQTSYSVSDIIGIASKNEQKQNKSDLIKYLSEFCEKNNIKISLELKSEENGGIGRIILSGNVSNAGTVIDSDSWKVLAMPPRQPNPKFSRKIVGQNLSKYEITKIVDGTIATLYYYGECWNISTTNGYDVSNMTWLGEKTFACLIMEVLLGNAKFAEASGLSDSLDETGRLMFSKLSRDYYYTIGFRHENIHLPHAGMKCPKRVVWFLNSNDPKIDDSPMRLLPVQSVVNIKGAGNIDELFTKAPSDYGYILKNDSETLLVESGLMKYLKMCVYSIPKIAGLDSSNRVLFVIIRAFLSDDRDKFFSLFPAFANEHKKCQIIYRGIMTSITSVATEQKVNPIYYDLASTIYNKMRKVDAINANHQNWKIIANFIGSEYTLQFMDVYNEKFD